MTLKDQRKKSVVIKKVVKAFYAKEGPHGVQERLVKMQIERSISRLEKVASQMGISKRDPKVAETTRKVVEARYGELGPRGTAKFLKDEHGITAEPGYIKGLASNIGVKSGVGPQAKAEETKAASAKAEREKREVMDFYNLLLPLLKKLRRVRNQQAHELLGPDKKNDARGRLTKLVELGHLVGVADKENDCTWYFHNGINFYTPKELLELVPESEVDRVMGLLEKESKTISDCCHLLYGDKHRGRDFLFVLLDDLVGKGWVNKTKNTYKINPAMQELGAEGMSIQAALNQVFLDDFRGQQGPKTLKEARVAQASEISKKTTSVIKIKPSANNDLPWTMMWGESQIGALMTSLGFQDDAIDAIKRFPPELKPEHIFASGTVYGEHKWILNDLRRTEQESLSRYPWQLDVAVDLIKRLKGLVRDPESGKVIERLGDKDVYMANQFAITVMKAHRAARFHGIEPATLSLEERRAFYNRDYDQHRKLQYMMVQVYQRLAGRTLLNEREVHERIGVRVSEVRLIIETLALLKKKQPVPESYKMVLDMGALDAARNPEKQFKEPYIVTPDNVHFKCGEITGTIFHDITHTPIPQRQDPFMALQERIRGLQAIGAKPPHVMVSMHPQRFVAEYFPTERGEHGTMGITTPSMKDLKLLAEGKLQGFYEGVREDEAWRQLTLRREVTQPGVVLLRGGRLNCYSFMILDQHVLDVMEANKGKPEVTKRIVHVSDTHWGGLPMTPELAIRFMSLGLYEMGANALWLNGDWLHGRNYLQSFHESAKTTLISMDKMNVFGDVAILRPFLSKNVSPNLDEITAHEGNHEYNTLGVGLTGWAGMRNSITSASSFMEAQKRNATITMSGTLTEDGDSFKWPYYANDYCGYKLAMTHNVFPKGKDPQFFTINWFKGLSHYSSKLFAIFCGDRHHFKALRWHNSYGFWGGRMCQASGYEWFHGMKGAWMGMIIEVSNKRPPIVHLISRDFLEQYRCKDPFFGPIEKRDELSVYGVDKDGNPDHKKPWVYESVPFSYSKYTNDWIRKLHGSQTI